MVNVAICDDSVQFLDTLQDKIRGCFEKNNKECLVRCFSSWDKLRKTDEKFDVYFLDVEMPETNGFEIAGMIRKEQGRKPDIVFVTAHDDAVFDVFKYEAVGFVRKSKLDADLEKTTAIILKKWRRNYRYRVKSKDTMLQLSTENTIYAEVYSHESLIHCTDKVYSTGESLAQLEKKLSGADFIRTHRSYLVNPQYIQRIDIDTVTVGDFEANSNKEIPLSRRRAEKVKKLYSDYMADL